LQLGHQVMSKGNDDSILSSLTRAMFDTVMSTKLKGENVKSKWNVDFHLVKVVRKEQEALLGDAVGELSAISLGSIVSC